VISTWNSFNGFAFEIRTNAMAGAPPSFQSNGAIGVVGTPCLAFAQSAAEHGKRGDLDQSFPFATNGVEMRWLVIVVVEPKAIPKNRETSGIRTPIVSSR
jgi:hypothetical protein